MKTRGFTLIEAMAVVAIIGVLASLTVYTFSQAKRQGRDARRKSDLAAISLAFQARYDSKTCPGLLGSQDVGYYPGRSLIDANTPWAEVRNLANTPVDCGAFSEYLKTIPEEKSDPFTFPYKFSLSFIGTSSEGKHYRLVAHLEKQPSSQELFEFAKMNTVWQSDMFRGSSFPPNYNYVIGN